VIVMPTRHSQSAGAVTQVMNFLYCTASSTQPCTAGAGAAAVDIINYHMKPGNVLGMSVEDAIAYTYTNGRSVLQAAELAKPFWNGEAGYSGAGWKNAYSDPDMQASFVPRFFLLSWSLGVSAIAWYSWDISNTLAGTQAAQAWQETYSWMVGATLESPCSASGTVWSCDLQRADGTSARAIWDAAQSCSGGGCSTSSVAAPSGFAHYQDLAGGMHTISSATIPVGIKPILLLP
jgi:hypothetical protein